MANSTILMEWRSINKAASSSLITTTIECKYSLLKEGSCSSSALKDQEMANSPILMEWQSINKAASSSLTTTTIECK